MNDSRATAEEFAASVRRELVDAGVTPSGLSISGSDYEWDVRLIVGERTFVVGANWRDPVYCAEITSGRERNFIRSEFPHISDSTRLRKQLFALVKYALDHPSFDVGSGVPSVI